MGKIKRMMRNNGHDLINWHSIEALKWDKPIDYFFYDTIK